MSDSNFIRPELASQLRDVFRAIDNVLVREHGPRSRLKAPPPWGTPEPAVLARYGPGPIFELWCLMDAINTLRTAFTGRSTPPVQMEEPDEAPGLAVESPPPTDQGADQQLVLTAGNN